MGRDTTSESDSDLSTVAQTKHDVSAANEREFENEKPKERVRSDNKCNFEGCGKVFNRPWKLEAHIKLHKNERPFTCKEPGCGKAYTNTSHLKRHVRSCHSNPVEKAFIRCSAAGCAAVFKSRQFLSRHLRRVHAEFPFACTTPGCGRSFKRNRQLKEHSFSHTGVHPFRCEKCDKGFEKAYDLKRHARGHRTYSCLLGLCSETFISYKLYRKHLAALHNEHYNCPVCDKRFSTIGNRNAHLLSHREATFPCPHDGCTATFAQERYARMHAAHAHDANNRYPCTVAGCNKVFYWKRNLVHHNRLEHDPVKVPRKPKKKPAPRKDKGLPKQSMVSVMTGLPLTKKVDQKLIEKEDFTTDSELGEVIQSEHAQAPISRPETPSEESSAATIHPALPSDSAAPMQTEAPNHSTIPTDLAPSSPSALPTHLIPSTEGGGPANQPDTKITQGLM